MSESETDPDGVDDYRMLFPDLPEAVFVSLAFERLPLGEMRAWAADGYAELDRRRMTEASPRNRCPVS